MKTLTIATILALVASSASAFSTTRCYWIGSTYTCTTTGGGGVSTTRCTQIGTTVSCTSF
jgi:hypothetical protein